MALDPKCFVSTGVKQTLDIYPDSSGSSPAVKDPTGSPTHRTDYQSCLMGGIYKAGPPTRENSPSLFGVLQTHVKHNCPREG